MSPAAKAIWISIAVGLVVQVISVLVARSFPPEKVLVGWGIGALLRLVTLSAYALAIVPLLGLPLSPALLTLVIVFFVTMLIEPFLLNSRGSASQSPPIDNK